MLEFPKSDSRVVDNESLRLPDITTYLPANTDRKTAAALVALYRSHCVSVIESFRYCKERNLLKYFSAFNGTLTIPVQKLLSEPSISPWIKECDWLMYQKMIAFVAPLTTQVVPKLVQDAFSSISRRLTAHIAETLRIQPAHVALARLEPAHVFCNLLKHMLDVNQAANATAAWLCRSENRSQMWFDLKTLVDPHEMMTRANIPSCASHQMEQLFKHDIRDLLTPLEDAKPTWCQPFYSSQPNDSLPQGNRVVESSAVVGEEYNFPDKWVSFILHLPLVFPNHRAQCIVGKVNALWDCILHRLTLGGAQSFSAWWMTKVFFSEMMMWQVAKGGFMNGSPSTRRQLQQQLLAEKSSLSSSMSSAASSSSLSNDPLKDGNNNNNNNNSSAKPHANAPRNNELLMHNGEKKDGQAQRMIEKPMTVATADLEQKNDAINGHHDDSGIGLDEEDSMLVNKYGDMMASDPTDPEGDVVVV